jgi:hypothetical protein
MNAKSLLSAPFLTALATVISGFLTATGVIPHPLSDAFVGQLVTLILAVATGHTYATSKAAASVASVDTGAAVR